MYVVSTASYFQVVIYSITPAYMYLANDGFSTSLPMHNDVPWELGGDKRLRRERAVLFSTSLLHSKPSILHSAVKTFALAKVINTKQLES